MKKAANIIRWIGVVIFALMAIGALSYGGIFGALLLLLGGAIIAPLKPIRKLRGKLKLKTGISIALAVGFLFVGVLLTPASDTPTDTGNNDSQISDTVLDDTSESDTSAENSTDSQTENISKDETVSSSEDKTSSDTETGSSKPTASGIEAEKDEPLKLSDIPAYSGKAYVVINNNIPNFSASELKTKGYEKYSNLDSLGRTQTAIASVGKDTMPKADEERGAISSIYPTGWKQAKYDSISGKYLYNRCHLIGWQLSAENANKKNLITGTKYLNINGMLPFENMVADYIKETGNHVAYRITPIYKGNNLLASGIQMEAYSVEDDGKGICFNVYCYNVQPEITINYADGSSKGPSGSTSSKTESSSKPTNSSKPASSSKPTTEQENSSKIVYTTETGTKYHSAKSCSGLSKAKAIYETALSKAKANGLTPCSKCH